jgi:hypothetical protein
VSHPAHSSKTAGPSPLRARRHRGPSHARSSPRGMVLTRVRFSTPKHFGRAARPHSRRPEAPAPPGERAAPAAETALPVSIERSDAARVTAPGVTQPPRPDPCMHRQTGGSIARWVLRRSEVPARGGRPLATDGRRNGHGRSWATSSGSRDRRASRGSRFRQARAAGAAAVMRVGRPSS